MSNRPLFARHFRLAGRDLPATSASFRAESRLHHSAPYPRPMHAAAIANLRAVLLLLRGAEKNAHLSRLLGLRRRRRRASVPEHPRQPCGRTEGDWRQRLFTRDCRPARAARRFGARYAVSSCVTPSSTRPVDAQRRARRIRLPLFIPQLLKHKAIWRDVLLRPSRSADRPLCPSARRS